MSEEITAAVNSATENSKEENESAKTGGKKMKITEEKLEVLIAILLGVTAILTAWAGWISSLHGGNQATNYTTSNNLASMGNSMYNEASQNYLQDLMLWNTVNDYLFDKELALANGNTNEATLIDEKIDTLIADSCTQEFADAIDWALEEGKTPFDKEGFYDSYYADSLQILKEAEDTLEQGRKDNANGDAYGLVTVIYSVVLFLLGIVGIFKKIPNRVIIVAVSCVFLLIATIYMLTIPLPTGFSLMSFFVH